MLAVRELDEGPKPLFDLLGSFGTGFLSIGTRSIKRLEQAHRSRRPDS